MGYLAEQLCVSWIAGRLAAVLPMDELRRRAAAASVAPPLAEPWTAPRSSGRRASRRSALAPGEACSTGNWPPPGAPLFVDLGKTRGGGERCRGPMPCSAAGEAALLRLAALPGRPCPPGSSAGERLMLAVSFVSFSVLFSFVSLRFRVLICQTWPMYCA